MASLKAIRRRIASVRSTQQITRAMKLVAASRLRRAQEGLLKARPYHDTLARVADNLFASERAALGPSDNARDVALILTIGSDRGLCGGYNANVIRKAEEEVVRADREGREQVKFYVVGRKQRDHFRRARRTVAYERINNPSIANFALAQDFASRMMIEYRTGQVVEVGVVYSHFHSALSQRPVYERLLPIGKADKAEEEAARAVEYLVEPSPAELLPVVLRGYLEDSVFHALLEAEASEHGARMSAMDSATNNAADMINGLTLDMNRARQATITKELMDIVGGAEAIKG